MSNPKSADDKMDNSEDMTCVTVDEKQSWVEVLPKASKSFCFSSEDFADESFSIDSFLKRNRSKVTLEQLKDDLNSYLKVLKASMIELINEDYNDFINLTTNLMGFDKSINNLSEPLVQMKDQTFKIERQFYELIRQIENQTKRLHSIRQNKNQLNKIISVMNSLEKAEIWLKGYHSCDNNSNGLSSLEKLALILIKIETNLRSIEFDIPLLNDQIKPRFKSISQSLNQTLELEFFRAISDDNSEDFAVILRIYSLICKQSELENMFRLKIVKPYMDDVIYEASLEKLGTNLFYQKILEFIDIKCQLIIGVNDNSFSFLTNSVWSEISNCLVVRTPSLFSAGNPDQFHSKYLSTIDFINTFVEKSRIKKSDLERHPKYKEFLNKFNVEVYFHIRYQQIATKLESTLEEHTFDFDNNQNVFRFVVTKTLMECLNTCWLPQTVYLSILLPSFWRITVQLLSRYTFWLNNLKETDFNELPNEMSQQNTRLSNKIILMGLLIKDCELFIIESKKFFESNILGLIPSTVDTEELRTAFNESIDLLETNGLSNVVTLMKTSLTKQCDLFLKQVNDLPLLYRKTNKLPTKASNYINNCFDLIASIVLNDDNVWNSEWTSQIINEITTHYKQFATEVLLSVDMAEDSLKKLNEAKGSSAQIKTNSSDVSDDDKIRLQIHYDVQQYGRQIEDKLKIDKNSIQCLSELSEITKFSKY